MSLAAWCLVQLATITYRLEVRHQVWQRRRIIREHADLVRERWQARDTVQA